MQIFIPEPVKFILKTLEDGGYDAYIVGGCVRDSILGKNPKDWDITTDANPEEIQKLFKRTIPTGIKYGTVTVRVQQQSFEVTTFRKDGHYIKHRRPEDVIFTDDIEDDLGRRDFTMNAMAYSSKKGLLDPFGGIEDIARKIIRCVGKPKIRFQEDALRMLRGVRFAAQLGFDIDTNTARAIIEQSHLIQEISNERINEEFSKIMLVRKASLGLRYMEVLGLLKYIIPELADMIEYKGHIYNSGQEIWEHILAIVDNIECEIVPRLAGLLHKTANSQNILPDIEYKDYRKKYFIENAKRAEKILKCLKYDNKTIVQVYILLKEQLSKKELSELDFLGDRDIKKLINNIGKENLEYWFQFQIAIIKDYAESSHVEKIILLRHKINNILEEGQPLEKKDLNINGIDLIRLGYPQGPKIGNVLDFLLERVLDDPALNTKDKLIALAISYKSDLSVSTPYDSGCK